MSSSSFSSPMTGTVVQWLMQAGEVITAGVPVLILEAMKMEHEIVAHCDGALAHCFFKPGETVEEGEVLFTWVETASIPKPTAVILSTEPAANETMDIGKPSIERADLSQLRERLAFTLDAKRPAAVQRRRDRAQRTARENLEDLCDPGSLLEYGALAVAAQRSRRSLEDLIVNTPADGMVTGIATINAASFGPDKSSCAVLSYDATVLAGTQGAMNHYKTDRLLGVALQQQLPVVLFAEGGGGRPGDVDQITVAGLNITTFAKFAALSGQVPVLGIVSGRCFAGNAALLGCCDVIIATQDSNIGMGGPAMIEGGGLGKFKPEEIGSSDIQSKNGVIDCLVKDEAQAVQVAKQYLAFTQGVVSEWQAPDQTALRQAVPENRLRSYEVRKVVEGLVDQASSLELRPHFGIGILTYFARIEGRSLGIIANNTFHLGGAIDADAADKAARFMQLCESYGLPILSLIDTPGFMVGPEIEKQAQVRHVSRMFVTAAKLSVPFCSVILRKGYGLGAMAMAAGGFAAPLFTVSWPTGEFGGMGLEGAVKLGFKKELDAAAEGPTRQALYDQLLASYYERGQALNMATMLEIDAVIDPAETRAWILKGLRAGVQHQSSRHSEQQGAKSHAKRFIDTW